MGGEHRQAEQRRARDYRHSTSGPGSGDQRVQHSGHDDGIRKTSGTGVDHCGDDDRHGSTYRWLFLGPLGIQPSELVKVMVILVLARMFQDSEVKINAPDAENGEAVEESADEPTAVI